MTSIILGEKVKKFMRRASVVRKKVVKNE